MPKRLDIDQLGSQLTRFLSNEGPATSATARQHLGISQSTFSRAVSRVAADIMMTGKARATRYAARRSIEGCGKSEPIFEVDAAGNARLLARLHGVHPRGYYLEAQTDDAESGFYDDLPFFMADMRPSGFLGRLIPRRHPELVLPRDIRYWSSENSLAYLVRYGWDQIGSLIVGEEAYRLYVAHLTHPRDFFKGGETSPISPSLRALASRGFGGTRADPIDANERYRTYPRIAADVLAEGVPGSSAGGEQPKFLITKAPDTPVMVKFSPAVNDDVGQRHADLLVCEHVAHIVLNEHGQPAASSEIVFAEDRCFLEIERFDRIGPKGRRGLISLEALDAEYVGGMKSWTETAHTLLAQKRIDDNRYRKIRWLERFGQLIANSDRHHGNLSFFAEGGRILDLAPAYDMLPMMYSPRHGDLVEDAFTPPMPSPADSDIWRDVWNAATAFWRAVAFHPEVSGGFRSIAGANAEKLDSLSEVHHLLPKW